MQDEEDEPPEVVKSWKLQREKLVQARKAEAIRFLSCGCGTNGCTAEKENVPRVSIEPKKRLSRGQVNQTQETPSQHFRLAQRQESTYFLKNIQLRPELPHLDSPLPEGENKTDEGGTSEDQEQDVSAPYKISPSIAPQEEAPAHKRAPSVDLDIPSNRRTNSSATESELQQIRMVKSVRRLSIAGLPQELDIVEDDRSDRPQWESDVLNVLQQGGKNFRMFISVGKGGMMTLSSVLGKRNRETPLGVSEAGELKIESPEKHRLWSRRRTGVSYGHLLAVEDNYDPNFLDDSNLKSGKARVVMHLPGFMETVISFVNTKDLKRELNEKFRMNHAWINPTLTLSKIRRLRLKLADIVVEQQMEISTGALACVYLERLIYKGVVDRDNRKLIMSVCFVLAFKFNVEGGSRSEGSEGPTRLPGLCELFTSLESHLGVRKKEILHNEFLVFANLDLGLSVTPVQIAHHLKHLKAECVAREQGEKYRDLAFV